MKVFDYTVVAWKEKEGYVSKCPEIGVASCGDSISEAIKNLKEEDLIRRNKEKECYV